MKNRDRRIAPQMYYEGLTKAHWRSRLAKAAFALFCLETLFSVTYHSVYLFCGSTPKSVVAGFCALVAILICFSFRQPILLALGRALETRSIGNKVWLSFWLIFGVVLRLAWILRFPVTLKADHFTYFQIAAKMAQGDSNTGSYWPPGFSLFLAPWFMVFGVHLWVAGLCALLFFVATYFLTYALANRIQGGMTSRIAPMLVALWPGYLTLAGINCKESFLAVLVSAALLFYLKASDYRSIHDSNLATSNSDPGQPCRSVLFKWGFAIVAGLCMGVATLTQPGCMLFPVVILGFEMLRGTSVLGVIGRTAIFSVALIAAVLPWTYRNYLVFHRMILISTNGGSVFYRANNPLANADYRAEGEIPLPKDEIAADRLGYKLADEWITHHPGAFVVLMFRKQVVFLGDDALGAYETLKRDLNPSGVLYNSVRGVSNLFWLTEWTVLLYGIALLFRSGDWKIWYGLLFLPLVYQWAIDSVFESGSRHHVPYIAPIAILVGMVLSLAVQKELKPAQRAFAEQDVIARVQPHEL
ncbi:MAG: glycosyltransferase family 39 protein [Edaphobacter sp.]